MFTLIKYLYIRKKTFSSTTMYTKGGCICIRFTKFLTQQLVQLCTIEIAIKPSTLTELRLRFSHFELAILGLIIFRDKFSKKMVDNQFDKKVINYLSEQPLTKGFLEYLAFCDKNELKQLLCSTSNDN